MIILINLTILSALRIEVVSCDLGNNVNEYSPHNNCSYKMPVYLSFHPYHTIQQFGESTFTIDIMKAITLNKGKILSL